MKKIFLSILLLVIVLTSFSQSILHPNNSYGTGSNRAQFDSTVYFPTGCGAPTDTTSLRSYGFSGNGQKLKMAAIYFDSCGHNLYTYDPSTKTWPLIGGGIVSSDSIYQRNDSVFYTRIGSEHFTGIVLQPIQWTDPLPGDIQVIGADGSTIVNQRPLPNNCNSTNSISLSFLGGTTYGYNAGPYSINCIQYTIPNSGTLTVPVGTLLPGHFRTDAIVLDGGAFPTIITGDSSVDGVAILPQPNPANQILLGYVRIDSNATVATGPASTIVYNNNDSTEFSHSVSGGITASFVFLPGLDGSGDSSVRVTLAPNGSAIMFRSRNGKLRQSNFTKFSMWIKNNAVFNNNRNWVLRLYDGAAQVAGSNAITLTANRGYDKTATHLNQWQLISFDISDFGGQDQFDGWQLRNTGIGGTVNVQHDKIIFETGVITQPPVQAGNFLPLSFPNYQTVNANNFGVNFKNRDTIGTVFSYDLATNPVDPVKIGVNFSTGTFTPGSGHTVVAGTLGVNTSNYIALNHMLGTENWRIGGDFKPTAKSGTTGGFALEIPITGGMGFALTINFDLKDTACHISYQQGGTTPDFVNTNKHTSPFVYSATDSIKWWVEKTRRTITAVLHNYTTGDESVLVIENTTHQVGIPHIYFYSGMTLFGNITITDNGYKYPDVVILGNSITHGSDASVYGDTWHELYTSGMGYYSTLMASPAETTKETYLRIPEAIFSGAPLAILDPGPNDASLDTLSKYLTLCIRALKTAGIKVIVLTAIPNNAFSNVPRNDTIKNVSAREGATVGDPYTSLVNPAGGTTMNPDLNSDGTHPNKFGQAKIAPIVIAATLKAGFTKRKNILNANLPSTTKGDYIKLTPDGLAVSYSTVDGNYWPVQHEAFDSNTPSTEGTIYSKTGSIYFGGESRFGSTQSSPIVNISTINNLMTVRNFASYGVTTNPGIITFNGMQHRYDPGSYIDNHTGDYLLTQARDWNSINGLNEWTNVDNTFDATNFNWLYIHKKVSGVSTDLFKIKKTGQIWSHDSTIYSTGGYDAVVRNRATGNYELTTISGGGGSDSPDRINGPATADVTADMVSHDFSLTNDEGSEISLSHTALQFSKSGYGVFSITSSGNFFEDQHGTQKGLQYDADYSANYTSRSLIDKAYFQAQTNSISSGSGAPATTPSKIGDFYIDTAGFKLYFAKGTSSSGDWIIAN